MTYIRIGQWLVFCTALGTFFIAGALVGIKQMNGMDVLFLVSYGTFVALGYCATFKSTSTWLRNLQLLSVVAFGLVLVVKIVVLLVSGGMADV